MACTPPSAETRHKLNYNAAVIMTDDGVIIVDSHSKPSAARARQVVKKA